MTTSDLSVDRLVAAAALGRAVLLGRAVVTVTAAGAGLLIVARPERIVAVITIVVVATAAELLVLTRWPSVVARTLVVLIVDALPLAAVLALNTGGAAFYLFAAGCAALAGVLLGTRAWPLWALQAAVGFLAATGLLRAPGITPEVSAFVVAFPMVTVVAGLVAATVTAALVRHVDLLVSVINGAQRSAAASERARLARELHDSVAKTLRGVSFAAVALPAALRRQPALAEQLADVVSRGADAAAREARDLIEGLRLDNPDEPFGASLARQCREWGLSSGTHVRAEIDPIEPPVSVRYELTRILHEALRNVHQHAGATRTHVRLHRAGDTVHLLIRDDGHGFAVPADLTSLRSGGHFGVLGMTERAHAVGGTCTVHSGPGDGTAVRVEVPLAPVPRPLGAIGPGRP